MFYLANEGDVQPMQGVIAKCLMDMNHQKLFEEQNKQKASSDSASAKSDNGENEWIESQLVCDRGQSNA